MRRVVLLGLCALVATAACAQRRGGAGFGGAGFGGRGFGGAGIGARRVPFARGYGYGLGGLGYGYGTLPDDSGAGYGYPAAPAIFLVPPPPPQPPPAAPEPPPREVHPVVIEYKQPGGAPASAQGATQTFAIVLKDGSVRPATIVIAAGNALQYVDPEERHLSLALSEVDRDRTLQLNRERNLNLHLPAAP